MASDPEWSDEQRGFATIAASIGSGAQLELVATDLSGNQSVLALPPGAVLLAENDFEPHHAFRLGSCTWGVQFHPEYDCRIMRDYILAQADSLADSGRDIDSLLHTVRETPTANSILRRFASLAFA